MIEAGSETTNMQLNNMLMGILSNPDVVSRAHEELDRVIGSDRPPNFEDEPNLPYTRAIVKGLHPPYLYLF
jgi:cytochrome P450